VREQFDQVGAAALVYPVIHMEVDSYAISIHLNGYRFLGVAVWVCKACIKTLDLGLWESKQADRGHARGALSSLEKQTLPAARGGCSRGYGSAVRYRLETVVLALEQ
jgi:hypothetical protein